MKNAHKILVAKSGGKRSLGRHIDGWYSIKINLREQYVRVWAGFIWLMIRSIAGSCEHGFP